MSFVTRFLGNPEPAGFTAIQLDRFIALGVEENLNLDYKDIRASNDPGKLSEAICAFANSEGGLLVLGVEELKEDDGKGKIVRIRPGKITWGAKTLTKEAVESKLVARVHPWVEGLRIYPIRNEAGDVVFLIDVPQSHRPPHQAPDGKYYLRYNFQNLPMEHYQLEALFFRRLRPSLAPALDVLAVRQDGHEVDIRIGLLNFGGAVAKQPMFFCTIKNCTEVTEKKGGMFFAVQKNEYDPEEFTVSSQSPISAIHPLMLNYPGTIVLKYERSASLSIMVGAEDMMTKQFLSGIGVGFLKDTKHDFSKGPLRLIAIPTDKADLGGVGLFEDLLRQMGEKPDEFWKTLIAAVTAADVTPGATDESPAGEPPGGASESP